MNVESIKHCLRPWMAVDTWDTLHPLDERRFHRALRACFLEGGPSIESCDVEQAMLQLLDELYPTLAPVDRSGRVKPWVLRADTIGRYLCDNGERA